MTTVNKDVRLNYGRCPHLLLACIEKRCRNSGNLAVIMNKSKNNNFSMKNDDTELRFVRKSTNNVYFVFKNPYNHVIVLKLTNHHLLGLYNPTILFDVVKSLSDISALSNRDVQIVENEIIFPTVTETDFKIIFEKTILKLDRVIISEFEKFKIQLGSDCFILNRCLKISVPVMEHFLNKNVLKPLIHLANLYFKCFSTAPVCCRMQSIACEATIYDFEKFTYLNIAKHCNLYIKMCKLLYPFVAGVEDKWLKRHYLEVVPVTLVERFQEDEFIRFLENLQKLQNLKESSNVKQFIIPLSNGNFRVGSYFNFSADMLANCYNIEKLKSVIQIVKDLSLTVFKQEDFEFESKNYFEYNKVFFTFDEKNGSVEIENYPQCDDLSCKQIMNKICIVV